MHERGLAAVSRAESAVHHMDSTAVCPHGGGWHRLRLSCWGSRRSDDDGSYRRGADDFYCGIRSSWVNKQIKKKATGILSSSSEKSKVAKVGLTQPQISRGS